MLLALFAQTVSGVISRALAAVLLAETAVVAAIGLWQEWTHTLFFADDLQFANSYTRTSASRQSSRTQHVRALRRPRDRRARRAPLFDRIRPVYGLPLLGELLLGLYFSYSQSSFVALFAAVLVIGFVAGDRVSRRALAATAAALVLVAVGVVFAVARDESVRRVTSGRPARLAHLAGVRRPPRSLESASVPSRGRAAGSRTRASASGATSRTRRR